jgi:holo-[acyl-carrier protein] synthase
MIRGLGIDLLEIPRVVRLIERYGERFLRRAFTEAELALFPPSAQAAHHWAGRLAAKEAVMKALGTGWGDGVSWRQIEILRNRAGAPEVRLHGRAAERCRELGGERVWLSISHGQRFAIAQAIVEGE